MVTATTGPTDTPSLAPTKVMVTPTDTPVIVASETLPPTNTPISTSTPSPAPSATVTTPSSPSDSPLSEYITKIMAITMLLFSVIGSLALKEYWMLKSISKKWKHPWANLLPQIQNRTTTIINELEELEEITRSYSEHKLPVPPEIGAAIIRKRFSLLESRRQLSDVEKTARDSS